MSGAIDLFMTYQIIRRLATPFKEWDAYKVGIIDEDGNVLKKRRDLTKRDEYAAFGVFDVMVLNLKKLLGKLPGGKTRIGSYAAALFLIRESLNLNEDTFSERAFVLRFIEFYKKEINL